MMGKSPRILYVSAFSPHRSVCGSEVRSVQLLRALKQIGSLEMLVLDEMGTGLGLPSQKYYGSEIMDIVPVRRVSNNSWVDRLKWTVDPTRPFPSGYGVVEDGMRRVLARRNDFDLIWFFKLRSADMFPTVRWPCSVVDIDDIPSTYERAAFRVACGVTDRLLTLRRLLTWRRREELLGRRFTVISVCSEEDRHYLKDMGLKAPIHVIPNGFDKPSTEPVRAPATPPRLGFIGLFDHSKTLCPNVDGIHWFANTCWPLIKQEIPDARLRLVGLNSDGPLKPLGPDIDGLGWVPTPANEIGTWSLMVIPIRVGGGTRVKIAHGFSQKCPIVATSLGAHGYQARNLDDMYLADSAESFAQACIRAIRVPDEAARLAARAWSRFVEKWTWDAICPLVWAAAEDCLRRSSRTLH
jgi:glycosyltransferase involved in cell wall biosynthesis